MTQPWPKHPAQRFGKSTRRLAVATAVALSFSACGGLVVPESLSGRLNATESGAELLLEVDLVAGEWSGCDSPWLELTQRTEDNRVLVEIHGHHPVNDDPGECASMGDITGSAALPPILVDETLILDLSLGDETSSFKIERTEATLTLTTVERGSVRIGCGTWNAASACEELTAE